jgi:hypothetical protein
VNYSATFLAPYTNYATFKLNQQEWYKGRNVLLAVKRDENENVHFRNTLDLFPLRDTAKLYKNALINLYTGSTCPYVKGNNWTLFAPLLNYVDLSKLLNFAFGLGEQPLTTGNWRNNLKQCFG